MTPRRERRDFIGALNSLFARVAGWCFDHRWIVVAAALLALGGALAAASQARIDNSFEAYFDPADPTYREYEAYREDFGSDEVAYILYEAPDALHGPWNLEVMRKIADLAETLEDEVPFVYQAKSIVNAEIVRATDDGIDLRTIEDDFPETQAALLAVRDDFLAKPLLVGGIASEDGRYGAVILEMDRSSTDPLDEIRLDPEGGDGLENLYPQASEAVISEILERPEYAGIDFYHSGDIPLNAIYNRIIAEESAFLNGISAAVIALLLLLVFRSIVAALAPVVVVQLGVVVCVAFVALMGWKIDLAFGAMPTLLTAIGIAHSVHILAEFRSRFREVGDRREALVQTIYLVGTPCLMTSLTTAAGFASLSFVRIKSIAHYGVYGSFGVMAAFVLSFTLLMALLSFGRRTPKAGAELTASAKGSARAKAILTAIADFDVRHRVAILATFGVVTATCLAGGFRVVVDSNWLEDFSYDVPIKGITERVDSVMGGMTSVIYLFDAGEEDGIKNPEVLREMERVEQLAMSEGTLVRKTYSIVDILKDLNQAFHGGDPAYYTIPDSRELIAQYLILYELSGGEEAEELVSSDYRRASLELRLGLEMTSHSAELVERIDQGLAEQPLQASTVELTGMGALWIILLEYIVSSQLEGFTLAFGVIGLIMILVFRSFQVGLISMIPNLMPVVLTLGVMGWFGIPLDYTKISIAAVAMGIAVDDTIHLVMRYRHEFLIHGDYVVALREAMQDVGRALLITSAALVLGFLVFLLSVMDSQATFGILLCVTIVTALVADFLLMPALVLTFKPFGPEGVRERAEAVPLDRAA